MSAAGTASDPFRCCDDGIDVSRVSQVWRRTYYFKSRAVTVRFKTDGRNAVHCRVEGAPFKPRKDLHIVGAVRVSAGVEGVPLSAQCFGVEAVLHDAAAEQLTAIIRFALKQRQVKFKLVGYVAKSSRNNSMDELLQFGFQPWADVSVMAHALLALQTWLW